MDKEANAEQTVVIPQLGIQRSHAAVLNSLNDCPADIGICKAQQACANAVGGHIVIMIPIMYFQMRMTLHKLLFASYANLSARA